MLKKHIVAPVTIEVADAGYIPNRVPGRMRQTA